jgi:LPXTG-motif cell wall-anchored protein
MKRLFLLAAATLLIALASVTPASAQYQPMFCTVDPTVVPVGGTVTVTAGYFEPGSSVEIRVESDPVVLGSLVAAADGTVSGSYALPLSVTVGSHVVYAKGPRLGTNVVTEVSAAITVIDAGVSPASTAPGASSSGGLPQTGVDPGLLVAIGAALLATGGLLVINHRNRRRAAA